jgi:hypothetical protein
MEQKHIQRLILKDDDILVLHLPYVVFQRKDAMRSLYTQIKKQLLPRKNKILVLPEDFQLSVIGKEQIKEYVSSVDFWDLWDDEGEEENV